MQKLGIAESFTEPVTLYHLAHQRGMNAVTITDHNVIDGALEIAHLPNAFVSCEYTTYFTEQRCKIHVCVYDITETQHRDLTQARENIYDLVAYLQQHNIRHSCAHPLFWINDRLTVDHLEKLLLLFKNWEWNGDMAHDMNVVTKFICDELTQEDIERMADKHGIVPNFPEPWKKNITAGSDDHSSLNLARTYTEVSGASTLEEFWEGVHSNRGKIRCNPASPQTFARNIYGIGFQFYKSQFNMERYVSKDVFLHFIDCTLQARLDPTPKPGWISALVSAGRRVKRRSETTNGMLLEIARNEAEKLIKHDPHLKAIVQNAGMHAQDLDQRWFEFVNKISGHVIVHFGRLLGDQLMRARIFDLFASVGSAGTLYFLLAPFFISYGHFARQRNWSATVLDYFGKGKPARNLIQARKPRVAHFTDTLHEPNGVALTINSQRKAALKLGLDYTILTCQTQGSPFMEGVHQFRSVGNYQLPDYDLINLNFPSFLDVLEHCYEENYSHIHVSTPGPMGLTALGVARILRIPISGTYHTAIPEFASMITDDGMVGDLLWKYLSWFFEQLDGVYVPSMATGRELANRGIRSEKIHTYPRGVDLEVFNPARVEPLGSIKGIDPHSVKFLYTGRITKEKNLHVLVKAFDQLCNSGLNVSLVVAGEGRYQGKMAKKLKGLPVHFTGYLAPDELARLYTSCDVLVFPSATDTFGSVVLEAQACGLPVIVSSAGGPAENMVPDETGLVVEPNCPEPLAAAMETLAIDGELRERMSRAARQYAMQRCHVDAFRELYTMYLNEHVDEQRQESFRRFMMDASVPFDIAVV